MGQLPPYLRRQPSGIYKYRRRVPDSLKGQTVGDTTFPVSEWIFSLGTREPREARRLRDGIAAQHDDLIAIAELELTGRGDGQDAARLREERLAADALVKASAERKAAREPFRIAMREALQISTAALPPETAAMIDIIREQQDTPVEVLAAATEAVRAVNNVRGGKTLTDAVAIYTEHRVAKKTGSTQRANGTAFAFLKAVLGDGIRLPSITRDDARRALLMLHRQPSDQWVARGKPPKERARIAERDGLPLLATNTIADGYLAFWRALFKYAVNEGWLDRSVFDGLTPEVSGRVTEKRMPFTDSELAGLFGKAPWYPADTAPSAKAIRYWGPIIALYHGLRRGEIAQLRADLFRDERGIILFDVAGDVKTGNAERRLALHPELIRLGLFDFAKQRAGAGMLFAGEKPDERGIWGDAFGDWFSRHLKQRGIGKRGQGLHALRHNFEDALREAELHQTAIGQYLGGRAASDPVGAGYGAGDSGKRLFEAISKVQYPGISL